MANRDRQSLQDLLGASRQILDYTRGQTRETLAGDPLRLDAVLYELVIIGEAARRLSQELRAAHPVR